MARRPTTDGYVYETVAASQTDQVLGSASAGKGDYIARLILIVSTAATAATTLTDGTTAIAVFPNSPGGGVGTYVIDIGLTSVVGAWKLTTGAGVAAIAVGYFS
jgi:hypothetical protein